MTIAADDRSNVLKAVAGELFNAGRIATARQQVIKDRNVSGSGRYLDQIELKGAMGTARIMKDLK